MTRDILTPYAARNAVTHDARAATDTMHMPNPVPSEAGRARTPGPGAR